MARKRAAKQEAAAGQDAATEAAKPNAGNVSMTKTDAVRVALAEGIDQPEEGIAFIKKKFDIDMTRPQFSTNKSLIRKKDGTRGSGKPGRRPKVAVAAPAMPKPSSNGPAGLAIQVEAIKSLVDILGVEQVVSIARLFAK